MAKGEDIPNGEILYKYIFPSAIPKDQSKLPLSIFEQKELSTDWKKYREDPKTSFHIKEGKTIVVEICVNDEIRNPRNPKRTGQIVKEWAQEIIHDPVSELDDFVHGGNYSHSLIKGRKKAPVTYAIAKHSKFYSVTE